MVSVERAGESRKETLEANDLIPRIIGLFVYWLVFPKVMMKFFMWSGSGGARF